MALDQLITFFQSIQLPKEPIKLNDFITVTDAQLFVDGFIARAQAGDRDAREQLEQFRVALKTSVKDDQ